MGRVLLVRHGETDGNRKKVLQLPSTPLNANGHGQAAKAARRIARDFAVTEIICSDLQRTQDTAAPLVKATNLTPTLSELLQERSFGDLRGQPFEFLARNNIQPFDPSYSPPGGESVPEFHVRAERAWEVVLERASALATDQVLAVVTHGLVLDALVKKHVQIPVEAQLAKVIAFKNTSLTFVDTNAEPDLDGRFPLVDELFNDDSHLEDEDRDPTFNKVLSSI